MSHLTGEAGLAALIERAAVELPLVQLHKLAGALGQHAGPTVVARRDTINAVPTAVFRQHAAAISVAWADTSPELTGPALALAVIAAAGAAAEVREAQHVEVVWTGPTSYEVPVRSTGAVLIDLIDSAKRQLIIVSFAAYKVQSVLDRLTEATSRHVEVRLILESTEESNGRLSYDARRAFRSLGDSVTFFVWPAELRKTSTGGQLAMHAKCVVADGRAAFVTSANLTGFGITENMELGLLVQRGPVPRRIASHFMALIESGTLRRVH